MTFRQTDAMEIQDVAGEEWCGQQATGLGRTRVWTGHQGMTSWAILDELLTPPAVYPMPCGSLWACQMLPGAHAADLGVVGLLVTTSLLQGWGCASRRSHLGQGECHSQGTGTPIPAYSPTWGGALKQKVRAPSGIPPLPMRRVLCARKPSSFLLFWPGWGKRGPKMG